MTMSERDWQSRVMDTARVYGWKVVHIRATEIRKGRWAVPYEGDKGLPDLILARDGNVLLVELKTDDGYVTKEQNEWLTELGDYGEIWRPCQWETVLGILSAPRW